VRWLVAILVALAALSLATPSLAHKPGLSRVDGHVEGTSVVVDIVFAQGEVLALTPSLDADKSGTLDDAELSRGLASLQRDVVDHVSVERGGAACTGKALSATAEENDGIRTHARYECTSAGSPVRITFGLFDELASGHRSFVSFVGGLSSGETILSREHATASFEVTGTTPQANDGGGHALGTFPSIVLLGVEHILTGWDHLLFLFGLVLVGGRFRSTLAVITAFTIAHSITLAVAALGVFTPSPRIIEPAIALSIAYVGAENFVVHDVAKRWRITFPFGLVHGFGFAGALAEIHIPKARIPATLFGFNLGVELGQIGVLVVVVPLLTWARKREWFRGRGVKVLSALIVAVGAALFVQRVVEG
jgi:hydrogenase/urease accessory protein HupE